MPRTLQSLSPAELDEMEEGRLERLSEIAELFAWGVHQIMGANISDRSWFDKFGSFKDFVMFHRPPHWIPPPEEDE